MQEDLAMGEQNRRAVEVEPPAASAAPHAPRPAHPNPHAPEPGSPERQALSPEADERQTARQAPAGASPGESAEDDSIG
jgi:hypothetical protein